MTSDPGLIWRVIEDGAQSGADNMARDHALALCLGAEEAVLRLYAWRVPTVSFGRNEPSLGRYDRDDAATRGIDFVRRPTGGRAVLHAAEVTYSVVAPLRALGGLRDAYLRINQALVAALASLGVPASAAEDSAALPLDAGPCFQSPAGGEVVVQGAKLVGSAQARVEGALLQHGAIIMDGDQSALDELRGDGVVPDAPASVRTWAAEASFDQVSASVRRAFELAFGGGWNEAGYRSRELEEASRLRDEKYALDSWTWRR